MASCYILVVPVILSLWCAGVGASYNASVADVCEMSPSGPWGALVEAWATGAEAAEGGARRGRILSLPPTNGYYVTDRIDRPSAPPPPRPGYDEWPRMTPPPPPNPAKVVNRPPYPYKPGFGKPGSSQQQQQQQHQQQHQQQQQQQQHQQQQHQQQRPQQQQQQQQRPPTVDRVDDPPRKEVTETDLYLLGAIEKLVYRVDLMEKRLRRMEESVHYLVAGADTPPDPCVEQYRRVGGVCYHFSREQYDWKTANLACRKLRGNLLELETEGERRQLIAAVQADAALKGADYWTGGLNPGLLWIWSNSARPIVGSSGNTTATSPANNTTTAEVSAQSHIYGEGRCLALAHDPALRAYVYRGQDCALRQRFVCEKAEDKTKLSNEIERAARKIKFDGKTRKPKIMWIDE